MCLFLLKWHVYNIFITIFYPHAFFSLCLFVCPSVCLSVCLTAWLADWLAGSISFPSCYDSKLVSLRIVSQVIQYIRAPLYLLSVLLCRIIFLHLFSHTSIFFFSFGSLLFNSGYHSIYVTIFSKKSIL